MALAQWERREGPLAMLMEEIELEEIEQESKSGPDETTTDISAGVINCDDWLAVIYDQHWWLAKAVTVDAHNQDFQVEFFHPHMPNTRLHPKQKRICASYQLNIFWSN